MTITQIARLQVCIPQSAFLGIGAVISDTYRKQRLLILFSGCVAKEAQLPGEELGDEVSSEGYSLFTFTTEGLPLLAKHSPHVK